MLVSLRHELPADEESYGWGQGGDGGFTERHPELRTSKGTIKLRPRDAAAIADDELLGLVSAALEA